jgi:hypothetical protein
MAASKLSDRLRALGVRDCAVVILVSSDMPYVDETCRLIIVWSSHR